MGNTVSSENSGNSVLEICFLMEILTYSAREAWKGSGDTHISYQLQKKRLCEDTSTEIKPEIKSSVRFWFFSETKSMSVWRSKQWSQGKIFGKMKYLDVFQRLLTLWGTHSFKNQEEKKPENLFSMFTGDSTRINGLNWQKRHVQWGGDVVGQHALGCGWGFQELVGQEPVSNSITILPWASRETRWPFVIPPSQRAKMTFSDPSQTIISSSWIVWIQDGRECYMLWWWGVQEWLRTSTFSPLQSGDPSHWVES